ncbi:MAG: acylneuraminate cytidylyltransferase family protein [Candidatus Rokuibacteriota bacterium]
MVNAVSPAPSVVGMMPARAGSKRVKNKNIRPLAGHPLIAYTIAAARASGVFSAVLVSTDSPLIAEVARHYGAETPFLRPAEFAGETSPDIEWVEDTLKRLGAEGRAYDCFSILRPTSPFRQPETIERAWREFVQETGVDSLRAVERCKQHPAKMWVVRGRRMTPLLPLGPQEQPWHSSQYPSLPLVYAQNASLEIAWSRVALEGRTIAGEVLMPFFTQGHEGTDINDARDWFYAEHLIRTGEARLPVVTEVPFQLDPALVETGTGA